MKRIIALDVGAGRIGIAVSDPLGLTAQPLTVINRTTPAKDIEALASVAAGLSATRIVVGLPLDIEGLPGKAAEKMLSFSERLRGATGLEVEVWDERFTTAYSERLMVSAGVSRKDRKKKIDKVAAACILQGYLDRMNSREE